MATFGFEGQMIMVNPLMPNNPYRCCAVSPLN